MTRRLARCCTSTLDAMPGSFGPARPLGLPECASHASPPRSSPGTGRLRDLPLRPDPSHSPVPVQRATGGSVPPGPASSKRPRRELPAGTSSRPGQELAPLHRVPSLSPAPPLPEHRDQRPESHPGRAPTQIDDAGPGTKSARPRSELARSGGPAARRDNALLHPCFSRPDQAVLSRINLPRKSMEIRAIRDTRPPRRSTPTSPRCPALPPASPRPATATRRPSGPESRYRRLP